MDDDLPLSSLATKKTKPSKKRGASPKRSASPKRKRKRAVLKAYTLDAGLLGEVTNIQDFISRNREDIPAKVGFVVLGQDFPMLIDKQRQLDALPPGEYNAQIIYAHPTQAQLESFERRRRTSGVAKASRLK